MANYVLLNEVTVSSAVATITFSNIPQTGYTDLKVVASARSTANGGQNIYLKFNGTTSGYSDRFLFGNGTSAGSTNSGTTSAGCACVVPGADFTASTFGNGDIYIPNYTSGNNKTFASDAVTENNATLSYQQFFSNLWSNTAAISSIEFFISSGNFAVGSTLSLYGVAALGTTPVIAPKASGGDIVVNDGTYWYHAFINTGIFTPSQALTSSVMSVGGGGGGACFGGGGGGGELDLFSNQNLTTTNYSVIVGAGGAGAGLYSINAPNGSTSSFGSLVSSLGGGGGGGDPAGGGVNASAGGSGGGGGKGLTGGGASGSNTNAGGNGGGNDANVMAAGGGGGATAAGAAGTSVANTSATGGNGGQGYALSNISGLTAALPTLFSGMTRISSGGGGGAFKTDASGGSNPVGGTGGTGAGDGGYARQSNSPLVAPTASTSFGSGGGGSASSANSTLGRGTSGYQGLVVIRYTIA